MNEQQRKLLITFWDENSALILACAQAISEDPDASPEEQESARNIVEQCKKVNQRDRSKYICKNPDGRCTDPMGKGRIVLHVVKSYAEKLNCTYDELKEAFSPRWVEKIENVKKDTRIKRYFISEKDLIHLKSGETIAVSSQCGDSTSLINFADFVKKAYGLGYLITEEGS